MLAAILLAAMVRPAAGLTWNQHEPQRDDRFYSGADRDFIGESLDWSGVGVVQSGSGWATMISDRYFLSAKHVGLANQKTSVDFYRTNVLDTSADNFARMQIDPSFGVKVAGTDLWLGRMVDVPPSWVKRYPLIQRPQATNYVSYLDPTLYVYGFTGSGALDYRKAGLGINNIDTAQTSYTIAGSTGIGLAWTRDPLGAADEADFYHGGGDSSGPTFVPSPDGGLALAGIHWLVAGNSSVDSNVSAYVDQIINVVPEHVNVVTDLLADLNGDERVNSTDLVMFSRKFGLGSTSTYNDGDLNGDGYVNVSDLVGLAQNFGTSKFAPSDFNQDQSVDRLDMKQIATHWHTHVTAHTNGDATGNGYVDGSDIAVLNANWLFGTWTTSYPTNPSPADINQDGLVDNVDYTFLVDHTGFNCGTQACDGADLNHDGYVNDADFAILSSSWELYGPADINRDFKVNNTDLTVLLSHWSQKVTGDESVGDLNTDGVVNALDFEIMADWWGRGMWSFSPQPTLNAVPEPATALVAGIAMLFAVAIRRRR